MSLKETVENDLKAAMRSKDKDKIRALRAIKSLILLGETEKGAQGAISEQAELALLTKAAKQRTDSAQLYRDQGRSDLAEIEESELAIIKEYLPAQMSEEELVSYLTELISELGATGPSDMGKVMGTANQKLKGKADGATIARQVKTILSSL